MNAFSYNPSLSHVVLYVFDTNRVNGHRERMSRARVIIPGKDQSCVFVKVTHGPFNPLTCGWVGVKMTNETFQEQ